MPIMRHLSENITMREIYDRYDENIVHILVFSPNGEQIWEHFWTSEDDPTNLLDSVADVKDMICGENYLSVDDICSE